MIIFLRSIIRVFSFIFRPFNRKWRKGELIKCLVVGYGGANNTGAEARTVEAIRQMLEADPRIHITLTSLNRKQTLRYISEHNRLRVVQINSIFIGCILRLVLKSDIIVLVEGSCFKDNFSSALLWFFLYAADLAQKLGKPTVAYAVDAGNMKPANKKWACNVANCMDLLITRTQAAKNLLEKIGVKKEIKVTTDTAFTQKSAGAKWVDECLSSTSLDSRWPIVGICFEEFFWWPVEINVWKAICGVKKDRYKSIYYHSWDDRAKANSKKMKEDMAAYADFLAKEFGAQIVFFAMEHLDIAPCRDVQSMMRTRSIIFDADNYNAAQITALLRKLTWLVTCRYHALILSMEGGVPVIGISHDERIESVMNELKLAGDYLINYTDENILDKLKDKTRKTISQREDMSASIHDALPAYLARMTKNGEYFCELIKVKFPS